MSEFNYSVLKATNIPGDILQEIPTEDITELLTLLRTNKPYTLSICEFISVRSEWKRKNPKENFHIYSPGGVWKNGTIICVATSDIQRITVYTLQKSCEDLESALQNTNLINWQCKYYEIDFVLDIHYKAVHNVLMSKNVKQENIQTVQIDQFWISWEKHKPYDIQCPTNVYLKNLDIEHATIIDPTWFHGKSEKSMHYLEKCIKHNENVGMFCRDTNKLLAWILRTDYGFGSLYVESSHRNRGYATIMIKKLINIMTEKESDSVIQAFRSNTASQNVIRKMGCEILETNSYTGIRINILKESDK